MGNGQSGTGTMEARAHPRWPTDLEVLYGAQQLARGRALDLSERGIGFSGAVGYPVGSDIEIHFRQGAPVEWFKARGVVRHSGRDRMGVEFVGLGMFDRTRIQEMIHRGMTEGGGNA